MTAAVVQTPVKTAAGGGPASIDRAFAADVTADNYIIVISTIQFPYSGTAAAVVHQLTDTIDAGAYSQINSPTATLASDEYTRIFYKKVAASGPCTVTLTPSVGITKLRLIVMEVSGLDGTTPLEDDNAGDGTSASPSAGNVATAAGGFVIAMALNANNYNTISAAGSGYTSYSAAELYGYQLIKYKVVTSGTHTGDFTQSSAPWVALVAAFKEAGSSGYTLPADSGSFALTGQTAGLLATRTVSTDNGAYALTGQDVTLQKDTPGAFTMPADAGSYVWTGEAALGDYAMNAGSGSYALTGQDVTFSIGVPTAYSLAVDAGAYAWTGNNTRLDWSGAPIVPSRGAGIYMGMRIGL